MDAIRFTTRFWYKAILRKDGASSKNESCNYELRESNAVESGGKLRLRIALRHYRTRSGSDCTQPSHRIELVVGRGAVATAPGSGSRLHAIFASY
jgi:hypothetical protein